MRKRDRYLTGILLILIGVLSGTVLTIYQQGNWIDDRAEVKFTEVKRSDTPLFTGEELAKMDPRFLFQNVAEKITPAVVYIETVVNVNSDDIPDDELHNDFFDRFRQRRARTVGSGVIITEDGYILTNNHVIENAVNNGIRVGLNNKRVFNARVVGRDPTTDLAVLKIDATGLPAVVIGNSDKVSVGEWVLAIGNPFQLRSTVTAGIVSALSRNVDIINEQMRIESFIQTDAAINRGNSGGALVNTSAELVGINTAIASQSGNYQGYGFAVPSNLASKVARDLIQYGEVRRALLGVSIVGVDARRAEDLGMDFIGGVEIVSIVDDGAADQAGLQEHDVVLSVNGAEVNEANELQEKIAVLRPGEIANLEIWREGNVIAHEVELKMMEDLPQLSSARPGSEQGTGEDPERLEEEPFGVSGLGFRVRAIPSAEDSEQMDLVITEVALGTEAFKQGLEEGFIIRKVNDKTVEDLQTLEDLIAEQIEVDGTVTLQVETQEGDTQSYRLNK